MILKKFGALIMSAFISVLVAKDRDLALSDEAIESEFVVPQKPIEDRSDQNFLTILLVQESSPLFNDLKMLNKSISEDNQKVFFESLMQLCSLRLIDKNELARKLLDSDSSDCLLDLLQDGLDISVNNSYGENLFHNAAKNLASSRCLNVLIQWLKNHLESDEQMLSQLKVLFQQDQDGNTPIHVAYNNKKFKEGDKMVQLIQENLSSDSEFDPYLAILNKDGVNLKTCRSSNRFEQIGSLALSGMLFALMIGTTLYDVLNNDIN